MGESSGEMSATHLQTEYMHPLRALWALLDSRERGTSCGSVFRASWTRRERRGNEDEGGGWC